MKKGAEGVNAACAGRCGNGCECTEKYAQRIRGLIRKRARTRVRNGYTGRYAGGCKTKQARERVRVRVSRVQNECERGCAGRCMCERHTHHNFAKADIAAGLFARLTRPPYLPALLARWYRAVHTCKHAVQSHQNECNRQTNWQQNAYRLNRRRNIRLPHLEGSSVVRV